MDVLKINKALSNPTRLDILKWLKDPDQHFPPHRELGHFDFGVCVLYIQEKAGLSQSTVSHYLTQMQNAGLVIPTRVGKWTYYRRDEDTIHSYLQTLNKSL